MIKDLFKKYENVPGVYYSFRNNKTLDINPKYAWYDTPSAIYCYNLETTPLKQSTFRTLKDNGFVYFFKLKSSKHINFDNYNKNDFEKDLDILVKKYPNILTSEFIADTKEMCRSHKQYSAFIWLITKRLSKKTSKPIIDPDGEEIHTYFERWRSIFKDELGYKYVEDSGYGIIYNGSEPSQVAILDQSIIEVLDVDTFDKTLFESRFFANYLLEEI
jgi:hypothetical protein